MRQLTDRLQRLGTLLLNLLGVSAGRILLLLHPAVGLASHARCQACGERLLQRRMDRGGAPQKHHERRDHAGHHRFEAIKAELSQLVHDLLGWLHSLAAVHNLRLGTVGSRGVAGRHAVSRGSRRSRRSRRSRCSCSIRRAGGFSMSLQELLQPALDQGAHVFLQLVLQRS